MGKGANETVVASPLAVVTRKDDDLVETQPDVSLEDVTVDDSDTEYPDCCCSSTRIEPEQSREYMSRNPLSRILFLWYTVHGRTDWL